MALNIKDDNFEAIVAEGKPVVLDFWGYMVWSLQANCSIYRRTGRRV